MIQENKLTKVLTGQPLLRRRVAQFEALSQTLAPRLRAQSSSYPTSPTNFTSPHVVFQIAVFTICLSFVKRRSVLSRADNEFDSHCCRCCYCARRTSVPHDRCVAGLFSAQNRPQWSVIFAFCVKMLMPSQQFEKKKKINVVQIIQPKKPTFAV